MNYPNGMVILDNPQELVVGWVEIRQVNQFRLAIYKQDDEIRFPILTLPIIHEFDSPLPDPHDIDETLYT
jgi:CO dehydrogenase/acetyl-CoA synthase gamma subunit (corrinoid Fe-S protein)